MANDDWEPCVSELELQSEDWLSWLTVFDIFSLSSRYSGPATHSGQDSEVKAHLRHADVFYEGVIDLWGEEVVCLNAA